MHQHRSRARAHGPIPWLGLRRIVVRPTLRFRRSRMPTGAAASLSSVAASRDTVPALIDSRGQRVAGGPCRGSPSPLAAEKLCPERHGGVVDSTVDGRFASVAYSHLACMLHPVGFWRSLVLQHPNIYLRAMPYACSPTPPLAPLGSSTERRRGHERLGNAQATVSLRFVSHLNRESS